MASFKKWVGAVMLLCGAIAGSPPAWTQSPAHAAAKERARITLSTALPRLDGDHLTATVVEVNYGPGESSPPHSHPCAVVGQVVEGAIRFQVNGEPETIYKAGESFYEAPNRVHAVSANASKTAPARLIAFLICDHEAPISTDVPQSAPKGK